MSLALSESAFPAFLKAMAPRFLDRLRKGDAGDAQDQRESAAAAGTPARLLPPVHPKVHWWQHARVKKKAPAAEQHQGDQQPDDCFAAPGGAGAPGHSGSSSRDDEQDPVNAQQQTAVARSGSRAAIDDNVATAATATTNLGLGNLVLPPPGPSPPLTSSQQRRSSADDRSRSGGGSSGSRDAKPSLDSVLPSNSGGGGGAEGGGGSGGSSTPPASGRSSAAARAPPARPQQQQKQKQTQTPPAPLSKPPLPPTAAEQIIASSSKQPGALPSSSQQQQQQWRSSCSSSSSAAAAPVPLAATLKEVAPAAPLPQKPKLTGMAAFDVAERYSFDVAGSAALGSPARPERAGGGIDEGGTAAAAAASAPTTTPRPAPPPQAPLRSSLDAPVSQRQSMESTGSMGRPGGGNAAGGYTSGGGASAASSTARSARSSFALEAADRPAAATASRGASPPPPSLHPSSTATVTVGSGGPPRRSSEELCPLAGSFGGGGASSSFSSPAAAAVAVEWLPPLEASAAFLPSLPSCLISRASSLALVPQDTPLPASLLWRLWGLQKGSEEEKGEESLLAAAATAIADELAAPGAGAVMKVARLADGSAWALTSPAAHAALVQARLGGPAGEHRELLSAYCLRGGALEGADRKTPGSLSGSLLPTSDPASASEAAALLATCPDDGYLMHNVGHHLAAAGALPAMAALLGDASWLDAKLRSYGAAAVTADFRRALALAQQAEQRAKDEEEAQRRAGGGGGEEAAAVPSSPRPPPVSTAERIRLLLAAFQMSAPAAVACPAARGVLGAQMASRLLAAERALLSPRASPAAAGAPAVAPKLLQLPSPAAAARDKAADEEEEAERLPPAARGLRTATPSLQQAGGAARLVLRGHTSPVLRVLIAPNGVDVVAVAADGAVRVFDLEVGDCVLHVPAISLAPPSPSSAPSSSSPARLLGGSGKTAAATVSYSSLSAFPLPSAAAAAKAASPAAFAVSPAAAAATNPRLRDGNAVEDAALDGSGRLLLTACADGVARVWDLAAATPAGGADSPSSSSACLVRELDGGPRAAPLHAAALCASGRTAATAGSDGLLRLWDVEAGACVAALSAHSGAGVRALALSPDGGVALTGGEDFGAVAWDVRRLRPQAVFEGHSGWVVSVALVPPPASAPGSVRRALTASHDGTARVWELRSGACAHVLEGHGGRLSAVRASLDGLTALTASDDGTARIWDLDSGACLRVMDPGGGGGAFGVSIPTAPDGAGWIADAVLGGGSGGDAAPPARAPSDAEGARRPHPPSPRLPPSVVAAACGDGRVAAFDASSGKLLALLPGHAGPALCVAATRRGRFVVTGGADGTARVWDLAAPSSPGLLARKHAGRVCCIAVSEAAAGAGPGSPLPVVVTVGDDGALAWSPSGAPLPPLRGGNTPTRWARASPDGRAVAVASPDGGLRAWRAAVAAADPSDRPGSGANLPALEPGVAGGPGSRVRAFDAAPTARVALLATYDSAVRVVRYGEGGGSGGGPASPPPPAFLLQSRGGGPGTGPRSAPGERGHPGVGHARLSADGLVAATASVDGSARLWCARTGRCLAKLVPAAGAPDPKSGSSSGPPPPPAPVVATSLSLDGRTLLVVGADGAANAWDLSSAVESAKRGDEDSSSHPAPTFVPRSLAAAGSGTVGGRLSPDGARALLWCGNGGGGTTNPATVWLLRDDSSGSSSLRSMPSTQMLAHLESPTGGVSATAWSRDGKSAALGSADGTLRVVCTETGRTTGFFMADAGVTAVAFCERAAVVGCDDGSVHFVALE